jgi:hypothetical protein
VSGGEGVAAASAIGDGNGGGGSGCCSSEKWRDVCKVSGGGGGGGAATLRPACRKAAVKLLIMTFDCAGDRRQLVRGWRQALGCLRRNARMPVGTCVTRGSGKDP